MARSLGLTSESDVEEDDGFAFPRLGYGNFVRHHCFGGEGRNERMERREVYGPENRRTDEQSRSRVKGSIRAGES
jgi:hypothetical protein